MDDTYIPGILDFDALHKQNMNRKNIIWSDSTTRLVFALIVHNKKAHITPCIP